jgi:hypothetical protein
MRVRVLSGVPFFSLLRRLMVIYWYGKTFLAYQKEDIMGTAAETIHVNADNGQVFASVTEAKPLDVLMSAALPSHVTLGSIQLSDLFFNHENKN